MALFGNIDDLARVLSADPRFKSAFLYLDRCRVAGSVEERRIADLALDAVEKIPLEDGAVAMDQAYRSRERGDCFFESHRKHIDVQCILEGEEIIDVIGIADLEVDRPYREDKDVAKYRDPGSGSRLRLKAGQAAVFFPEDGHMPGQFLVSPGLVRKTVIKVPVAPPTT